MTAGAYKRFLAPMPPISLAYVATALVKSGQSVQIYDDYTFGGDEAHLVRCVENLKPDVIGLSCVTPTAARTYQVSRIVKKNFPDAKLVLGNIHASVFYEDILKQGIADYVVIGEGEESIVELCSALEEGKPATSVGGVACLEDGEVAVNKNRSYVQNLDNIPFPAWHLFPLEHYKLFNFAVIREPGMLVLGSRGCPYNCSFCSLQIMGNKRRRRSAVNIADEFEWLLDNYGYKQMSFIDPIFPIAKKEGAEFSEELIRRGLHKKIVWTTETRVDLVDEELLVKMRESGLKRIMYGFESGSQAGIDMIKKNFTVDHARKAVAATKKAGVEIIGFFMIGVPGDTVKSINETINYSTTLGIDFAKYTVFSPFPGTKVYSDMLADGTIPKTDKWESFTNYPTPGQPAIFLPEGVSNETMMRLQRKAFLKFYIRPSNILNHLFRVRTLNFADMINGLRLVLKI